MQLPGVHMRIYDGGKSQFFKVMGDFIFWSDDGMCYLIECKATHLPSFPFDKIANHQLYDLLRFEGKNRRSVVAFNFYDKDNIKRKNDCYLLDAKHLINYMASQYLAEDGRRSMPEWAIQKLGYRCEPDSGFWRLDFDGIKQ